MRIFVVGIVFQGEIFSSYVDRPKTKLFTHEAFEPESRHAESEWVNNCISGRISEFLKDYIINHRMEGHSLYTESKSDANIYRTITNLRPKSDPVNFVYIDSEGKDSGYFLRDLDDDQSTDISDISDDFDEYAFFDALLSWYDTIHTNAHRAWGSLCLIDICKCLQSAFDSTSMPWFKHWINTANKKLHACGKSHDN